jgi:hypothetical protein
MHQTAGRDLPARAVDDQRVDTAVEPLFKILGQICLPPDDKRQIGVKMGEDNVLHLRGIPAFEHKADLFAADDLFALIGAAQRLDPGPCTRRLSFWQGEDEEGATGMLRSHIIEQVVVGQKLAAVLGVDGQIDERSTGLGFIPFPKLFEGTINARDGSFETKAVEVGIVEIGRGHDGGKSGFFDCPFNPARITTAI